MAQFFIDRPIFAWVIGILVMLGGALSIFGLPVSQYPAIAPPTISVYASYPGASARTLEDTVTQVIEQRMNGLDHLRYMASSSDSSGNAQVTLTFDAGTDPDIAQVQVQNKLQLAVPQLPQEVQRQGLRVAKSVSNFLLIIGLHSEDGSMSRNDITDYAYANLTDQISRVSGVGEVTTFGAPYAMRIWLDPTQLAKYRLTPIDVAAAVAAQNAQVSAGQLGGLPAVEGQRLTATITAQTRLQTPEQFRAILLRVDPDGARVRLADVARVELAGETFEIETFINNRPSGGIGVRLAAGANALQTAAAVKARVEELARYFPPGLRATYPVDTTPFVRISIEEVVKTLLEAVLLVFLVMYLFLQNFRATLIPTIAVPVVLLGTFGVLAAFGFGINTLTMFGLVLAIGLLVDDAIVVVENVERVMSQEGLPPRSATRKSMRQITGALVGIALVLSAVFVPMAFFGGSVGVIYRQFSITIVSSMVLSVLVALSLTPALCATILTPVEKGHGLARQGFFGWFNRTYERGAGQYQGIVGFLLKRRVRGLIGYLVLVAALAGLFSRLPTGFLPQEDQGLMYVQTILPPGSTMEQSKQVLARISNHLLTEEKESIESVLSIAGFNFGSRGQNAAVAWVRFKPWDERTDARLRADAVAARVQKAMASIKEANVFAFTPPAVTELGNANGFELQLQDRANLGHDALMAARNQLLDLARKDPRLAKVRPGGLEDTPQFNIDVDQQKAAALGVPLAEINQVLASTWGAAYLNDFMDKGRTKRVYMQADAPFRMNPEDLNRWYARNRAGEMVPFSTFASGRWTFGPPKLERFNGISSVAIQGEPSAGHSSGEAMAALEGMVAQLPAGVGFEWSGLSYEERLSGAGAPLLYAISLLVVFLALAALYESWSIPVSVMLVVPLGVLGSVLAMLLRGLTNDVFFQVGLLTTVGLSAKNAILIVEFAKELHERGHGVVEAALEAARMRLRPIIMTSLAFVLGVLPLAIARGAGAGGQVAIGTAVIGGMLSATALAILYVPLFFVLVARRARPRERPMGGLLAPLLLLGLVAGCSMAPRYERPTAPVAAGFPAGGPAPVAAPAAADLGWRDVFGDPRLQALVALALEQNRDLRVAALHVELVQAQYRIQRAQRLPQVGASGVATILRTPGDLTTSGAATTSEAWAVGLGMTGFELDFFGRVKSLSDAALEQFLATEEARRSAQLSLVASVATQYLAGRALEEQVTLTRETLDSVVEALRLMRRAFEAGRVSELDLRSAEAQVEAARFALATAELQRARAEIALVLLVGGPLPADLPPPLPLDGSQVVAGLQAGIPSEVLVRRPDILAAEHALLSANATIGAARAAFFPSISLTAFDGTASVSLTGLFQAGSANWSFVPRINIPIFAGGALRASLDAAEVRKSMEVARYERAIQGAFREVADALIAQSWLEAQQQALTARVAAESRRYELSERRYRGGIDSYLNVLTAQRDLFASRQQLIQTRLARLSNLVDLYKALGGGWRERSTEEPGGAGPPTPAGARAGTAGGATGS